MKQRSLILALSAAMVCASPLAFAQDATTGDQSTPPETPTTSTTTTEQTEQSTSADASAMSATPATDARKVTWDDLDADHNGSLTKTEASALDSLAQVFDTADTDKDGALTGDEYRAYLKTSGKADTGADATGDSDMDDGGQK